MKHEAFDGLTAALRSVKAHDFGTLLAATLACDLRRYPAAVAIAGRVSSRGTDAIYALALTYESAMLFPQDLDGYDGLATAADAERRARAHLTARRKWHPQWESMALERLDEHIRQHAIAARTEVEGEAFTRFLSTEADFCKNERRAEIQGFDETNIPDDLRDLIPLAQRFGIGDDVCRGLVVRRTPLAERQSIVAEVDVRSRRISAWLATLSEPPYWREASCFFWLLEAAEEMTLARRRTR